MGELRILPQRILSPYAYTSLVPLIGGEEDQSIVRTATKVVAASDAADYEKAQSDTPCTGTADDVLIQAAIDAT